MDNIFRVSAFSGTMDLFPLQRLPGYWFSHYHDSEAAGCQGYCEAEERGDHSTASKMLQTFYRDLAVFFMFILLRLLQAFG